MNAKCVLQKAQRDVLLRQIVKEGLAIQDQFQPEPLYKTTGRGSYKSATVAEMAAAKKVRCSLDQGDSLVVVMGDVHGCLDLAFQGIERIEAEFAIPIRQVFSVGDLGLFLAEEDWNYLTGPSKYRRPERSAAIRKAWKDWRWPLSAIAGNHEPFNRLRCFDPGYFAGKLSYQNAGILEHGISADLTVYGLSGIYHPENLEFCSKEDRLRQPSVKSGSWEDLLKGVQRQSFSRSKLTYYKQAELAKLMCLPPQPSLMLMHDWPKAPDHVSFHYDRRPEAELVEALKPRIVCCGHHHCHDRFQFAEADCHALNIICAKDNPRRILPGWALLLKWSQARRELEVLTSWPDTGIS